MPIGVKVINENININALMIWFIHRFIVLYHFNFVATNLDNFSPIFFICLFCLKEKNLVTALLKSHF